MTGTVFDIQEFSVHDGPGARVTVFLKGCPLRCIWCHNPEGLSREPELMVKLGSCTNCGRCRQKCVHEECRSFDRCLFACPEGLISVVGSEIEAKDLADKLLGYRDFFEFSSGGITFSGGEPLMQADFVVELMEHLGGIHCAIQTSGYARETVFRKVVDSIDYVMMDIKIANSQRHKQYTGVDNELILRNLEYLKNSGKHFEIRVPLIPGITDTEQNLAEVSEAVGDSEIVFLPYNSAAGAKYPMVGRVYEYKDS